MKYRILASASALLVLAACSETQSTGNETAAAGPALSREDVLAEVNSVKLQPGEWAVEQEIIDVKVTGLPKDVPDTAMTQLIGQKSTDTICLTPEQAANPSAELFSAQQGADCDFTRMEVAGGKVVGDILCKLANSTSTARIIMRGDYLPHRYDMDLEVDAKGLPNNMAMTMRMKSSAKWVRECPKGGSEGSVDGNSAG